MLTPLPTASNVWGVDAGGSRTTAVVLRSDGEASLSEFGSISIGTVGAATASAVLGTIFESLRRELKADELAFGCVGSSSAPVAMESAYPEVFVKVIESRAPAGSVLLVNDMVPLLYAPPLSGVGVVISSGTGSCVLGRNSSGQLAKIGGHEHIVSDEGSAYSLGRAGLRAAARAVDGTGPATVLSDLAIEQFGMTIPALGRWLAENRSARAIVAGFAPVVLEASTDSVAWKIVESNAASLADAAIVALERLNLGAEPSMGFSGGVMRGSAFYRGLVEKFVKAHGFHPVTYVLDGPNAVLSIATQLRDQHCGEAVTSPFPGPDQGLCLSVTDPPNRRIGVS
jgi:N-acetylglucosamine kinase-like BadF-type ATPase